jgi:hypothetical protein
MTSSHAKLPEIAGTVFVLIDSVKESHVQNAEIATRFEVPEPRILVPPSLIITLPPVQLHQAEPASPWIDWRAEGEKVTRDILRKELKSSLSRASPEPDEDAAEPGVFGSQSANGRAGKVETFDDGERHWISDNCYFDFDRRPSEPTQASDLRVQAVRCKPPPTGGGANMFKDLYPKVLRDEKQK